MRHRWLFAVVMAAAPLVATWPAYAQSAPRAAPQSAPLAAPAPLTGADPLQAICTSFLDQGGGGVSGDRNRLCSCLARETKSRLTQDEMTAYKNATDKGQVPPDALMQKVMGIATVCLTEAAGK